MTATKTVKDVALTFLKREDAGVLVLKGAWGVGKTFAWRALVEANRDIIKPQLYSYVSLFGVRSIADLRLAILSKRRSRETIGERTGIADFLMLDVNEAFKRSYGWITRNAPEAKAPYLGNVSVALESIAGSLIDPSVVCLDDFERTSLPPDQVLGLISELKEEKNCKVVLIFNESQLGEKEEQFRLYHEKVVDIELSYEPTTAETAAIAFPKSFAHHLLATECAEKLGLKNIRILKRAGHVIELVTAACPGIHPKLIEQLVMTTVLVAWSIYAEGERVPIELVKRWNSYAVTMRRVARKSTQKEVPNDGSERWEALLDGYPYTSTDNVDLALIRVMERGFIEESGLLEAVAIKNEELKQLDLRQSFTNAWRKYHDSFGDNRAEMLAEMESSLKVGAHLIEPINLDATVRLFRDMSETARADALIDAYIAAQTKSDVFDIEQSPFQKDIKDEQVLKRFRAEIAKRAPMSLKEAMYVLSRGGGWSPEHIEALRQATDEELYNFFTEDHKQSLRPLVEGSLRLRENDTQSETGWKVARVLQRIAGESPLNEIRMKRYEIEPFVGPPPPPAQ